MNEEKDILERISAMEVQIKEIGEIKSKLDSLYDVIIEMKLTTASSKADFATKAECQECRRSIDKRLDEADAGRKKLLWASVAAGLSFTAWLAEQVLHITLKIG